MSREDTSLGGWLMQRVKRLSQKSYATCRFYELRYLAYISSCETSYNRESK